MILITVQPSWSTRSSALVTLLQPSVDSGLKVTNHSSACHTSFVEQALHTCSFSVWCIIITHFCSGHHHALILYQLLTFLMVFSVLVLNPSFSQSLSLHSHLSLLRLISCSLTTQCLAVTGGISIGKCDRLSRHFGCTIMNNIVIIAYLFASVHFLSEWKNKRVILWALEICFWCINWQQRMMWVHNFWGD